METEDFYLVLARSGKNRRKPTVRRVVKSWPQLIPGEAIVKLRLVIPDDLFVHPVTTVHVPVEHATVAVESEA